MIPRTSQPRRPVRLVPLIAAALLVIGCADDPDETAPETDLVADDQAAPDQPDEPEGSAGPDAGSGDQGTVEVTLVDYAFGGVPGSLPAGSRLTVVNESDAELHEVVAFRLPDDEDRPVAELTELPPDELTATLGEPTTVLLAEPGGPQIDAVGDGTLGEPGRYALLCFIPVGADRQAYLAAAAEGEGPPDVEGGPPHFVEGMYGEVVVE